MEKPKQFIVGIIIILIGIIIAFLPLIDGIPSGVTSVSIPLICLGIFITVYSFDWTKHSLRYKRGKSLQGICAFENFYIDGVNIFDFWNGSEATIHIRCETRLGDELKFKTVDYSASVVKVKGKSMNFNAYIAEFSMAKYAIFIDNRIADQLLSSNPYRAEDNKLNFEHQLQIALSYEEQTADLYCCEVIYSEDKTKRARIVEGDNCFKILIEKIKFGSEEDYYYCDVISFPFWFWEIENSNNSFVDTLENATKIAKEYLH